jgi:hypothetical protein
MARVASAGLLASALLAATTSACSSSEKSLTANSPGIHELDAARPDAGPGVDGTGGSGAEPDGASGSHGGAAPADAALPDATPHPGGAMDGAPFDAALPPLVCRGAGSRFATGMVSYEFGPGQKIGQEYFPEWVLGPPKGAGACQGATTDVVSLGNGGVVVLEFAGNAIVDGPGPDFIVFENAFGVNCDLSNIFAELATVSVSNDGVTWTAFPCTATKPPYGQCAGTHVVYANADTNTIDPTDPSVSGGDPFDLADIGVPQARLVRITDRADTTGLNGVFDLDAVSIVHPFCP